MHAAEQSSCTGADCINWCCTQPACLGCGADVYCAEPPPPTLPSPPPNIRPLPPQAPPDANAKRPLVSSAAKQHLEQTFLPAWRGLFLVEGTDPDYPMPAAGEVRDLLPALRGVKGIAVKTDPGTTVTEGQAYAMLLAGMQRDTATLKALVVAWQANGQAFGGQPACGGCCSSGGWEKPPEVCAAAGRPGRGQRRNGLCLTVPGAYMPAWRMPMCVLNPTSKVPK